MSGILGTLGIEEAKAERTFINTIGQRVVYDAIQQELDKYNQELSTIMGLFVGETTSEFKRRYELPGGGYLQPMGTQSAPGNVKRTGNWDVAFPLLDYGAAFGRDRIGYAYMTAANLNSHLDTIFIQDRNTVRLEIMRALLDNAQFSFVDNTGRGTLSVEPLANGDSVLYPPVLGSQDEATENHYIETNYAAASISDTNNPCKTVADELEEHFGAPTGGSNVVFMATKTICDYVEALTDFDPVVNRNIQPGANTDIPVGLPAGTPGRVRGLCNGVWVVEWRWLPANYAIAIHGDAPRPLIMREDPPETGLNGGLRLVAEDEEYPFRSSYYSHRFGFGAGNRLNGVVLEFGTGGSYTVPTGYSRS